MQGRKIAEHVMGLHTIEHRHLDYDKAASAIFTEPEIADVGLAEAEVPEGGTHFNYMPKIGGGATIKLRDDLHFIGGVRFFHLSNGNLHGRDENPSQDGVQYFAGVHNPIGVKLGPTATPDEALELCERLNPERIPGRLTLVARMGAEQVFELLPPLLRAVREAEHPVVWACDPMHANLVRMSSGTKTRRSHMNKQSIAMLLREVAVAAGSEKLIAGQVADLEAEGKKEEAENLRRVPRCRADGGVVAG